MVKMSSNTPSGPVGTNDAGAGSGSTTSAEAAIEGLLAAAGLPAETAVERRRIGTDDAMVEAIIERIASGEKTMTYSLPWIAGREDRPEPAPGHVVAVLDARGAPRLLLRLRRVRRLAFGEISAADIAEEGIPMRDLDAWRPLHVAVWNQKLAPHGLAVDDDMPVWAEYFEVVADTGARE